MGRAPLIEQAVRWLTTPPATDRTAGVVLVGRPGSGTTAVAAEIAQRLRMLEPRDGGANAGAKPSGELAGLGFPLMIRDLHLLSDDVAAGLLRDADMQQRPVIATAREAATLPTSFARRWSEGSVWRVPVRPLTEDDVGELVAELVGLRPSAPLTRMLHTATDGLPLYLREMATELVASGGALRSEGVLVPAGCRLMPGAQLTALVAHRLAAYEHAGREVLEMVAVAGVLPLHDAIEVFEPDALAAAERTGLLQLTDGHLLELAPPIVGLAVERSLTLVARAAYRQRLLRQIPERDAPGELLVRMGRWLLEARDPSRGELMVRAADLACAAGDNELSGDLARRAIDDSRNADALGISELGEEVLARARLCAARSERFDETPRRALLTIEPLRAGTPAGEVTVAGVPAWVRARFMLADIEQFTLGDVSQALRTLAATLEEVVASVEPSMLPAVQRAIEIETVVHRAYAGELAAVLPTLEEVDADPMSLATERLRIAPALILGLTETGRGDDAVRFADRAARLSRAMAADDPTAVSEIVRVRAMARLMVLGPVGVADAPALCAPSIEGGAFRYDDGAHHLNAAALLMAEGFPAEALEEFLAAIAVFRIADPAGFMAAALAGAVQAAVSAGRTTLAAELADRWHDTATGISGMVEAEMGQNLLWYRYVQGGARAVEEAGLPLVARHEDDGMWGAALRTRYTMLRLGVPSEIPALRRLAPRVRGVLFEAMLGHLRGVAEGDGERLLIAAESFERQRSLLYAAECAAQAADLLREDSRRAATRRAAAQVRELRARLGAVTTPILGGWSAPVALTPREEQVASLVAEGLSSAEVGERLAISSRTVEAHLQRVYDKLGVNRRADLIGAFSGRS